jgi:hypothetical protein
MPALMFVTALEVPPDWEGATSVGVAVAGACGTMGLAAFALAGATACTLPDCGQADAKDRMNAMSGAQDKTNLLKLHIVLTSFCY